LRIEAAVLRELNSPLLLETVELDEPQPEEILVRIAGTGICHTDIALTHGQPFQIPRPIVLGHEGAGVVQAVGSAVHNFSIGDAVVLSFAHCGSCARCDHGEPAYCENFHLNFTGRRADGSHTLQSNGSLFGNFFGQSSFANYVVANERSAVKVPKDLPLHMLGPLGCGVQTGAGAVINALKPGVGDSIAIFGAGAVGLSAMMAARVMGLTQIIVVDLHESRLKLAAELGATHVIKAGQGDIAKEIAVVVPKGVNYSLDATGAPPAISAAMACLAVRGTCGIVGGGPPVTLNTPQLMQGGRKIVGIGMGDAVPSLMIPKLLELYRQGRFPFDRLTRVYSFDKINQAIADSESGLTIKPIIKMQM
jgi:aryl-alcohol dehydrogenase